MVNDTDAVGELVCLVHVVGGEEDGGPFVIDPFDVLPHPHPGLRVEPDGRFIEEENRRPGHQPAGYLKPPFHAAAQALGQFILFRLELDKF